jgi:16S rRNA (guanine966-N2)-methyltransferase
VLKITSGIYRGRLIQSLPGIETRPTTERLRQAWLNCLQMGLHDSRVLDLFSGSGALGLEALSRGAAFVIFVEANPKAAAVIQQNIKTLGVQDQAKIIIKKIESILPELSKEPPFDFILLDPPYNEGYEEKVLQNWPLQELLTPKGKICVESARQKGAGKEGGYAAPLWR